MHKTKKKKIAITAISTLMAFNVACSSTQPPKITETSKPKNEIVSEEKNVNEYKPPVREFNKFKGKSSVTIENKVEKIDEKEEKQECEFTDKYKEFNKQVAILKLRMNNKENISLDEICELRSLYTELTYLVESSLERTFTNRDNIGQIIVRNNKKEILEKSEDVNLIESYFYGVTKEYDFDRELVCFSNGDIIPTMVHLNFYAKNLVPKNLDFEDYCLINDYILKLNEILDAANSKKQKEHLIETIKSLWDLLPKQVQKDDNFKESCDILYRLR
jgi:hypothetical protein